MTCLQRRDSSEASVKETFLFHSRVGSILKRTVQQSGDYLINLITNFIVKIRYFSGPWASKPCVFPFKFNGVTFIGCIPVHSKVKILFIKHHNNLYYKHFQPYCSTKVDDNGVHVNGNEAECDPDCPMHPAFTTDNTLKVTHHKLGQQDTLIAVKLCVIMSISLCLIALVAKVLGISGSEK